MCFREELISGEQGEEGNSGENDDDDDNESFTEQPDEIPGLGSPLLVIQPDEDTPPQSPVPGKSSETQPEVSAASKEVRNYSPAVIFSYCRKRC